MSARPLVSAPASSPFAGDEALTRPAEERQDSAPAPRVAALAASALLALPGRRGDRLEVLSGRALVTQTGVAGDFDLAAGVALELPARGKVVAEALEPTRLAIRPLRRSWCDWWLATLRRPGNDAAGR